MAVLAVVVVVASVATSGFATYPNLSAMLVGNAYQSLLAVGMTFVIISGGIDLSVGSVFALVGGAGSLWGTAAGVLLLAVTQNLIGHYVAQYGSAPSDAVNGGFLALVVLLQAYLSRAQRIS